MQPFRSKARLSMRSSAVVVPSASALLGAVLTAAGSWLTSGLGHPVCAEASEGPALPSPVVVIDESAVRWVLLGLSVLPAAELLVLARRGWSSLLAAAARTAALAPLRA